MIARRLLVVSLAAIAATLLAPAALASAGTPPHTERVNQLYLQSARAGALRPTHGAGLRLVLKRPSAHTRSVFRDHGVTQRSRIPTRGFVASWAGFGFRKYPPTAVLGLRHARRDADAVALRLAHPRLDGRRLTYRARPAHRLGPNLGRFRPRLDRRLPRRFGAATLHIDQNRAPVGGGCAPGSVCGSPNGCVIEPFARCDHADLEGADLSGADLSGAHFSGANLNGADLSGADLSGADLSGADLSGADLSGADLSGADLTAADLSWANLSNAHLIGASLSRAELHDADLFQANLSDAHLIGASLNAANVSRADLSGAHLTDADLYGVHLSGANLHSADLIRANLSEADLSRAELNGADLSGAHLYGAYLYRADLSGTDLSGAVLLGADLTGTDLTGAKFCHTRMPDGSLNNSGC